METDYRRILRAAIAFVSAVVLGAGGLALGFALSLLAAVVLMLGAGVQLGPAAVIVLSLIFVQGVGCAGVALTYVAVRPRIAPVIRRALGFSDDGAPFDIGASVPDLRDLVVVVAGYVLGLSGAIAGSLLVSLTQVDTGTNQAAQVGLENPEVILILIPASFLVIGPGEELLFRGVVQGRLREVFGPVPGILIPSIVFAALHWFALSGGSATGNLLVIAVLVVPALVFGVSYEYTGNVVVPMLIHGAYNATLFTLLYAAVALGDQLPESAVAVATGLG